MFIRHPFRSNQIHHLLLGAVLALSVGCNSKRADDAGSAQGDDSEKSDDPSSDGADSDSPGDSANDTDDANDADSDNTDDDDADDTHDDDADDTHDDDADDTHDDDADDTDAGASYDPGVTADDFVDEIDHPFFPSRPPGTKWYYEAESEDGFEQVLVEVLPGKRDVWGVEATVIRDTVYVDGELAEDTWDWFAQDREGNVWYLGEETYEYEDGELVCDCGTWESGVDGALPGIILPAKLEPGEPYYQEFLPGVAEDQGQIVSVDETVETPAGTFDDCIKTHDTSALDTDIDSYKYYCAGVGFVMEEEADGTVKLIRFENDEYSVDITGDDLTTDISNPFFPATPGTSWVYEAETEDGTERIEIEVLEETKSVWGVEARVIRDTVYVDGELVEDTWDWFAQDAEGNVWYLGEDSHEYEEGEAICSCGSWESGVDGALPGIVMPADPSEGDAYYQEYLIGEAEDRGEIVELNVSISVPAGSFEGCLTTRDTSAVNPTADELKTYCPGVGVVQELEADEVVELIEYHTP
jgi:hypothetical protein